MFRIGEFSKTVKLTVKTLRFYDEVGLLTPEYTDKFTGYRYYTSGQLYTLQQIIALRQAGFSIEEIKYVLSGKDVSDLLLRKENELLGEKELIKEKLNRLGSIKKFYLEEQSMKYQALIKHLPSYTVYYKRFFVHSFMDYSTAIPEIGREISEVNPDLRCLEPDFCYVEYLDGEYKEFDFNVEYAQAVNKAGKETENIKFKILPPTVVACVMHKAPWQEIGKAYAYIINWIEENGYEICGNYREQYIDGCWNKEKEEDYLTEVQIPVRKRNDY